MDVQTIGNMSRMLNEIMFSYLDENASIDLLKRKSKMLLVRSGPEHIMKSFLQKISIINPELHLWVIGKKSDREILDEYFLGRYVLDEVDGVYSQDNIRPLKDYVPDIAAFFTTLPYDENYMNVMELLEKIYPGKEMLYCNFDHKIGMIKDYTKYMETLKLHLKLAEWYWKMI